MTAPTASRRRFLAASAATAAGLTLGLRLPAPARAAPGGATAPEVNAWVVITPDNKVVVRIGRVEMGQGTLTGLAQLVAEELDADWSSVTTEYPTPGQNRARNRVWGNFSTAGSRGVRDSQDAMRKGGAAARLMLVRAAAAEWGVPEAECRTERGTVRHDATGRSRTYGELAAAAARLDVPKDPPLKDPRTWTIAGQPLKRLDTAGKLNGSQVYSIDMTLPGMLSAAIRDCPVFGGRLASFDAARIEGMKGVRKVMRVGETGVAVIADTWWRAKSALDALPVTWDEGPNARLSSADIRAMLQEGLTAAQAFVGNESGDARAAIAGAARVVEATYSFPYQHHATMEPMNATALWTPDKCEVWTATQNAEAALATVAASSGLPIEACDVYRLNLGGGFGRRSSSHDFVRQAVLIAREMPGTPVKLIWSREEDFLHGHYHPVTMCRMTGALDAAGNLTGLHMRLSGQSILAGINPQALQNGRDPAAFQGLNPGGSEGVFGYAIPNLLIDHAMRNPPVPPGFWRGVNNNQNALYLECFMDELAAAAGKDPLEFRRALLARSPKHRAVLDAVAARAGWGTPAPMGVYRGLSQHMGYGSYVAACAEVKVEADGTVRVLRIVAATDPGHVVNPQQVAAQIEGSFAFGLSAALHGEITLQGGKVEQENFDTYPVIRMSEMPKVESIIMPSGGFWGGVGEPTIFVAAPAVLNAVAAATGRRVRDLPVRSQDLRRV